MNTSPPEKRTLAAPVCRHSEPGASPDVIQSAHSTRAAVRRALSGIGWTVLGSVAAQGGSFLSAVILAHVLGKLVFGQFAMIQSTVVAMTSLASLGLGVTASKYVSQYRDTYPEKASRILGISSSVAILAGALFSAALLVFAPRLAPDASLVPGLRLSAIFVFFTSLNGYQSGALIGMEAFGPMARISFISGPIAVLASWAFASWFGLCGGVLAQAWNSFLVWLLYQVVLRGHGGRSNVRVCYRGAWRERAALIRFSVPAIFSSIASSVAIWWCNKLLVTTSGYTELALFAAAGNLRLMVLFVPGIAARVVSPMLNNMLANGDIRTYRRAFWAAVAANGVLGLFLAVLLFLGGNFLLRLFGKGFVGSSTLLVLLLSSAVLEIVAGNLFQAIFTAASLWWQSGIAAVWAVVLTLVSHLALTSLGAAGLALSYLVAWSVSTILYGGVAFIRHGKARL